MERRQACQRSKSCRCSVALRDMLRQQVVGDASGRVVARGGAGLLQARATARDGSSNAGARRGAEFAEEERAMDDVPNARQPSTTWSHRVGLAMVWRQRDSDDAGGECGRHGTAEVTSRPS